MLTVHPRAFTLELTAPAAPAGARWGGDGWRSRPERRQREASGCCNGASVPPGLWVTGRHRGHHPPVSTLPRLRATSPLHRKLSVKAFVRHPPQAAYHSPFTCSWRSTCIHLFFANPFLNSCTARTQPRGTDRLKRNPPAAPSSLWGSPHRPGFPRPSPPPTAAARGVRT